MIERVSKICYLYYSDIIFMYVSVLFVKAFFSDPDYHLLGDKKSATYPYKNLTVSSRDCRSECLNDVLCNGYSIDLSNYGCFLSRCTNYTSVPNCSSCLFASKKLTQSTDYCFSASTTTPVTTAVQTEPVTSTETVNHTETITTMTSAASSGLPVTNDVTQFLINNTMCFCVCRETNQTLQESIEKRRNKLSINKPELSSNLRKLYSVSDYRMSSKVIGSVALIILVLAGILIILADISSVISIYSKTKNKKND